MALILGKNGLNGPVMLLIQLKLKISNTSLFL